MAYWFAARRYGWGWRPATWQGWAATTVYGVVLLLWVSLVDQAPGYINSVLWTLPPTAWSIAFLALCWKTGERPRWRWGN